MLRLPGALRNIFWHSKITLTEGTKSDTAGLQNISSLPFYQSFRQGLNLTLQNQLEEANQSFQKALNQLESQKQGLTDHYLHIHRKILKNNITLRRPLEAQKNIYDLIKLKKKYNHQSMLVYDDYNTLHQLFLRFNPQKAIVLGRALLTDKEVDNMSVGHKKQFLFNLGNAYFLVGNYSDAKARYSQCIQSDPNAHLKVMAYNNLALACWWHKNPLIPSQQIVSAPHRMQMIDSQFKQTRSIFLKALERSQYPPSIMDEKERDEMERMLAEQEFSNSCKFRQPNSVLPMYNLSQYYMNNQPEQRMRILCWLRALLDLTQRTASHQIGDQVYASLCILNNDRHELERFSRAAVDKYRDQYQEIYYCRLLGLIEGDKEKRGKLLERVSELEERYLKEDAYIYKRKYLEELPLEL